MPREPLERIHPESYAELRRLVQLHGAPRVLAALDEIIGADRKRARKLPEAPIALRKKRGEA